MRPTLRQLQYFVAVAEHGSFGIAAQRLAISQPSLSKLLAGMEDELGVMLFERTSRRVALTAMGEALLPRARSILLSVNDFRSLARSVANPLDNKLSIGVLPSIGAYYMPLANKHLHKRYPKLRLVVHEGTTTELLQQLRDGQLDAVIGATIESEDVTSRFLFAETLWICAAEDDPLSQSREPVTLNELQGRPFLSLSPSYSLTRTVEHLAALAGATVSQDYKGSSLDAVRQMAVIGAGVAILPSLYALAEAIRQPDFVVRRLDHPEAFHRIALHWRSSSPMADAFETLAQHLVAVKEQIRAARADPAGRRAS